MPVQDDDLEQVEFEYVSAPREYSLPIPDLKQEEPATPATAAAADEDADQQAANELAASSAPSGFVSAGAAVLADADAGDENERSGLGSATAGLGAATAGLGLTVGDAEMHIPCFGVVHCKRDYAQCLRQLASLPRHQQQRMSHVWRYQSLPLLHVLGTF